MSERAHLSYELAEIGGVEQHYIENAILAHILKAIPNTFPTTCICQYLWMKLAKDIELLSDVGIGEDVFATSSTHEPCSILMSCRVTRRLTSVPFCCAHTDARLSTVSGSHRSKTERVRR